MFVQVRRVAEVRIRNIAEAEIALHHLHQIEPNPLPHPVHQVRERRQHVV